MIASFLRFYFTRTLRNWRALRRECMDVLPKTEKAADIEVNGK